MKTLITVALLLATIVPTWAAPGWQERVGALWQERLRQIVENDVDRADGNPIESMEAWFGRQYNQGGQYCCSKADAYPFDGAYELTPGGGVRFKLADGQVVVLPPERMVQHKNPPDPNPTGGPVIWYSGTLTAGSPPANVYCFETGPLA